MTNKSISAVVGDLYSWFKYSLYGLINFFVTLNSKAGDPQILGKNGKIISLKQKLSIVPKKLALVSCAFEVHLRFSSALAFRVYVIAMTPL